MDPCYFHLVFSEDGAEEVHSETSDSSVRGSRTEKGSGKSSKKAVTLDTSTSVMTNEKIRSSQSPKSQSVISVGSKKTQKTMENERMGKENLDGSFSSRSKKEKPENPDMPKNLSFVSSQTKVSSRSTEDKSK